MYTIETKKAGPKVLLLSGVHGDEYEPILTALKLIEYLPGVLKSGTVTIVPLVNKSACENGTRCGIDGLDLARICPGSPEGTVTERSASQISEIIKKSDYLVDMHTGGLAFDIFPLAGYMLHPSPEILKKQQEMAIAFRLPLVWGTDYRPNGRTLSIARDANIPAIYLEYGGGTGIRENVVSEYMQGFLNLLKYLKMIDGTVSNTNFLWVEDHRHDSGHLQQKMPSPLDGIFTPMVRIGNHVKKGQLFGRVIDPGSGKYHDVHTDQHGLVFLLRINVKVRKGESLGGIMTTTPGKNKIVYDQ